ncbi:MAG: hypothetical protein ALAOOOJD_01100 [bacterium]|nr:hypothetical protein [bacterium]
MIGMAGDSRISFVPGRKAKPRTATPIPFNEGKCFCRREKICWGCCSLMRATASNSHIGRPAFSPCAIKAFTSLGRQLPPKPQPAQRKEVIGAFRRSPLGEARLRYLLRCSPCITSTTSMPPNAAPVLPISFEKEMSVANKAFEAYLIISAVLVLVFNFSTSGKTLYSFSKT